MKIVEEAIEKLYEKSKNTTFINETGGYGNNFKLQIIKDFNLNEKHTKMVHIISYGKLQNMIDDLKEKEII